MSLNKIILQGLKAGFFAGILWGILLVFFVVPVIHGMQHEAWSDHFLTLLGTLLLGISFGILSGLILGVGIKLGILGARVFHSPWISGLLFGLAGFAIFHGILFLIRLSSPHGTPEFHFVVLLASGIFWLVLGLSLFFLINSLHFHCTMKAQK